MRTFYYITTQKQQNYVSSGHCKEMQLTFINTALVIYKMYWESYYSLYFYFCKKINHQLLWSERCFLSIRFSKLEQIGKGMVSFVENVGGVEDIRKSNVLIISKINLIKNIDIAVQTNFNLRIEIKSPSLDAILDLIGNQIFEVKDDIW